MTLGWHDGSDPTFVVTADFSQSHFVIDGTKAIGLPGRVHAEISTEFGLPFNLTLKFSITRKIKVEVDEVTATRTSGGPRITASSLRQVRLEQLTSHAINKVAQGGTYTDGIVTISDETWLHPAPGLVEAFIKEAGTKRRGRAQLDRRRRGIEIWKEECAVRKYGAVERARQRLADEEGVDVDAVPRRTFQNWVKGAST